MLDGKKANIKIGGDFDPIPMDKYTVQIADVNLVTQFNKFKGEEVEMLNYQYIILDEKPMPDSEETTRGRFLWHRLGQSLGSRSWLLKLAKAVEGRDLTRDEMEKFDPEALVGRQVDVMVEQNPSKDGTAIYNNVVAYSKTLKVLEKVDFSAPKPEIEKESKPVAPTAEGMVNVGEVSAEEAFGEKAYQATMAKEEEGDVAELEAKLAEAKKKKEEALKA